MGRWERQIGQWAAGIGKKKKGVVLEEECLFLRAKKKSSGKSVIPTRSVTPVSKTSSQIEQEGRKVVYVVNLHGNQTAVSVYIYPRGSQRKIPWPQLPGLQPFTTPRGH